MSTAFDRVRVERAVGLVGELVLRQHLAAGERQRRVEAGALRDDGADGATRRGASAAPPVVAEKDGIR